jgi:hypothetical protein
MTSDGVPEPQTFTRAIWVKLPPPSYYTAFMQQWDGLAGWYYFIGTTPYGNVIFSLGLDTNGLTSQYNVSNNNWHLIVASYNQITGVQELVVDNNSPETVTYSPGSSLPGCSFPVTVGSDGSQSIPTQDMVIKGIGIWDRELSDSEISGLYTRGH